MGFLGSAIPAPVLGTHVVDHLETANHCFLGIEAGVNFLASGWCQVPSPGWCLPVLFRSGRSFAFSAMVSTMQCQSLSVQVVWGNPIPS